MIRNRKAKILALLVMAIGPFACAQQSASAKLAASAALDQQRRSLFAQRSSLKRQMGDTNFTALLGSTFYGTVRSLNSSFACLPLEIDKREDLISAAARQQAIQPDLLRAVMHRESGFHPCAVSIKGALGLMQLMPATIAQLHVSDPFDPAESIHAAAMLLRNLLDKYQGDLRLTLAAYNAGPSRIENADPESYPAETRNYIADILAEISARQNTDVTAQ